MSEHKGSHEGTPFSQWHLHGDWTPEEITEMETFFKEYMTPSCSYPWIVQKDRIGFIARRTHWDVYSMRGQTLTDFKENLKTYYETYEGI